eukprot:3398493-Rhodomonas_salina.1
MSTLGICHGNPSLTGMCVWMWRTPSENDADGEGVRGCGDADRERRAQGRVQRHGRRHRCHSRCCRGRKPAPQ